MKSSKRKTKEKYQKKQKKTDSSYTKEPSQGYCWISQQKSCRPGKEWKDTFKVLKEKNWIASSTRGQTAEARRTTILQPVEQKPHSQKDRQDEKAEDYVPDEGTR